MRRSFICSVLELTTWMIIMSLIILFTENLIFIIIGIFLCGATYLYLETLALKGKFKKIDDKIYTSNLFNFFSRHRKIFYLILIICSFLLTLLLFI